MLGFARKLVKQAEGIIAPEMSSNSPTHGFRILHVEPDLEAYHASLEPLFDFVTAANGQRFDRAFHPSTAGGHVIVEQEQSPADKFRSVVEATAAKLVLEVWSAKGHTTRIVTLPNPVKQSSGLGLTLQWASLSVADHVWHVLEVTPSSPADKAGLISHSDYIVAGENGSLEEGGEYLLGRVVSRENCMEGVLFYVYNRDFDLVRPVRIFPTRDGKLGCGVGYGLLHTLPEVSKSKLRAIPGSMVFDEQQSDAQYLDTSIKAKVPAPPTSSYVDRPPQVPPPPNGAHPHIRSAKNGKKEADNLSSYFEEQSQISRQIDGETCPSNSESIAPPPSIASA